VLRTFLSIVAGAADIPATILLGKSPDGMNATGDSDFRAYYDSIGSKQDNELRPLIERVDEVLIPSALGSRPEGGRLHLGAAVADGRDPGRDGLQDQGRGGEDLRRHRPHARSSRCRRASPTC
jgi:hypothetical protein